MKDEYRFCSNGFPGGYSWAHATSLFSMAEYRELHSQTGWQSYYLLDDKHRHIKGSAQFFLDGIVARCPLRAPFGAVDVSSDVSADVLVEFLHYIDNQLLLLNVSKIIVKLAPELYDPGRLVVMSNFFLTHHYKIHDAEVGAVIPVHMDFWELIHPRKKRKLQQSRTDELTFRLLDVNSFGEVYEFIAACRLPKKYELSISHDDLLRAVKRMPRHYPLFGVFFRGEMVAASVTIKVYDNILYHFISDHVRKLGSFSPALVLMEGIYDYCRSEKISMLDLGTSTVDGVPNFNLLNFKVELGARITHKFTFEKDLS